MNGRAFAAAAGLLVALACVLAGVLVLEYRTATAGGVPATPAAASAVRATPLAAARTAPDAAEEAEAALARPPFDPSRRPAANDDGAAPSLPRLTGVLVSDAGRVALFAGQGTARGAAVAAGGTVGRFTVRSVEPGQVVVDGPTGSRTLRPSFDGTQAAVAEAPPPPPGPARIPMEDLLRGKVPVGPPTPGLPAILGTAGPPPGTAAPVSLLNLLNTPLPGIGIPGLVPAGAPGAPSLLVRPVP